MQFVLKFILFLNTQSEFLTSVQSRNQPFLKWINPPFPCQKDEHFVHKAF